MATIISARVVDQSLLLLSAPKIASGGANECRVEVLFDDSWQGYGKAGVFRRNKSKTYRVVMTDDACIIPHEVLAEAGRVFFSIEGISGSVTHTTDEAVLVVSQGPITGVQALEPLPDVYKQLLSVYGQTVQKIAVESARIDNLAAGGTADGSEVADIRTDYTGKTHDSAGAAVREQTSELFACLDNAETAVNLNAGLVAINRYNKEDPRNKEGYYFNHDGYLAGSNYRVTHPIYVKRGAKYKMLFHTSMGTNYYMGYVDAAGGLLALEAGVVSDGFIVFTPTRSGFAVFNLGRNSADTFMVCLAEEYPEAYVGYYGSAMQASNPLNGKIVSFNGDSICAGAGYAGGYGKIISVRNGMTYENVAVGGGTVSAYTYTDAGAARHWVSRTIESMRSDADYIILEGGVNDAALGVKKGALSDGYTATLDEATFYGAFESMLKQALVKWPGKKIGYIAVHKMTSGYSSEYDGGYYQAALACCKKWGIPVCDLNVDCPPLKYIAELSAAYTANGDGWHPNEAGYKAYYCDKIESWMKTL